MLSRRSTKGQQAKLLNPPGCRLQITVPAGAVNAELELEVVEVIKVMKLLPLKVLPLLQLDLVHGSTDHLQDGLKVTLQLLVELNEKICEWNREYRTWIQLNMKQEMVHRKDVVQGGPACSPR